MCLGYGLNLSDLIALELARATQLFGLRLELVDSALSLGESLLRALIQRLHLALDRSQAVQPLIVGLYQAAKLLKHGADVVQLRLRVFLQCL